MKRRYIVRIGMECEAETEEGFELIADRLTSLFVGGVRGCGREGSYSYQHDGTLHLVEIAEDQGVDNDR